MPVLDAIPRQKRPLMSGRFPFLCLSVWFGGALLGPWRLHERGPVVWRYGVV